MKTAWLLLETRTLRPLMSAKPFMGSRHMAN